VRGSAGGPGDLKRLPRGDGQNCSKGKRGAFAVGGDDGIGEGDDDGGCGGWWGFAGGGVDAEDAGDGEFG